ncbi:DUF4197 domain-containing protein [Aurantiacibacter luteus]|uniref:DUF4197 domain-containing protein n=1 Tax=Aurantiacibacter luteus TaxID=1581420 RepID=A0A0G9MWT3_9SPHN|nr:DUF4197 domain-containing protein [Aurantiacibacter luteus]KLE35237.1 hypothetical protein AAW00_01805 [Aurantiacibacter luteus]
MSELANTSVIHSVASRRKFIAGVGLGAGVIALPGCASYGGWTMEDAIRRLLYLSSERAFARMLAPGGFWENQVGALGLENLLGTRGGVLANILTSSLFRDRLADAFADIAIEGAYRAAPLVTDAVRVIGFQNALALVQGGPTAATGFLRQNLGMTLVEAMVPELGRAMRVANEPLVGQLLAAATGVDVGGIANTLSRNIDNAIWNEMGFEETAIRRDPRATNDPVLIGVFGTAGAF